MTKEEILVQFLRALPKCVADCNSRVYHCEVHQGDIPENLINCGVYRVLDTTNAEELDQHSNYYSTTFEVVWIGRDTATVQRLVAETHTLGYEDVCNDVYADTNGQIHWITVEDNLEQGEFAIEQEEKGFKTATVLVTFDHFGVE